MNFMRNTFGGNPFGNFMALVQKFQQFASNPFGALMGLTDVEIPQILSNDPQGMVQHLRQSGQIAIAVAVDGATLGYSEMDVTPAAVEQYFHVSNKITVPIFRGCCQTVTVRNISDQPILMKNLVTGFKRDDL